MSSDDSLLDASSRPRRAGAGLSRRGVLKAAAAVAALTGTGQLGSAGLLSAPAQAEELPAASAYFDLRQPSSPVLLERRLHEAHRIMQSFAFDDVNQRLYVAQLQNASSGDDLCISELDLQGTLLGHMHLDGAGHGVSIGVEAVGDRSYLWTECRSSGSGLDGRGTALQRFEFVSGQAPTDVRTFLTGSGVITCAVDQAHSRLLVRQLVDGRMQLSVHDLATAASGDFGDPIHRLAAPGLAGVFQGYTSYGDHAYFLTGSGHHHARDIDSRLSVVDLRTGRTVQNGVRTFAGRGLPWREPEGMAVHRTPDGQPLLCFGLASHHRTVPGVRLANIYAKDVLVG